MPTTTGKATDLITFSRGTLATVTDADGKIKWAPHNLLSASEQFDASAWSKTSITLTANAVAAPNGTTTADTLTASGANGTALQSYTAIAVPYTFGVWLKRKTGTGTIEIAADNGTYTAVTITSDWALYTVTQTPAAGSKSAGIRLVTSGDAVEAWGAHLYRSDLGGMQANASAYPYYNPSTPKNLLGQSEDFANAAWNKQNATAVSATLAAPNGSNVVSLITATSNDGRAQRFDITTLSGTTYTMSAWLKRKTGSGAVRFYCQSAPSTGFSDDLGITTEWARYSWTFTATSTAANIRVPHLSVSGDEVYIWGAQLSDSASLDAYSPVFGAAPSAAAYHGPRLDYDPVTLSARGLLVEEGRTNLLTYSAAFDNVAWSKYALNTTGTPAWVNVGTAPDGTVTAEKLIDTTSVNDTPLIYRTETLTATSYTFSVYAKAVERSILYLRLDTGGAKYAYFNLSTGTVSNVNAAYTAAITSVGSGWYRCSITTTGTAASYTPVIGLAITAGTPTYTGDGTSGLLIWGAQLEAGAFATSYIPTAAATVTRNADVASVGVSQFPYSATEGTLVAYGSWNGSNDNYAVFSSFYVDVNNHLTLDANNTARSAQLNNRVAGTFTVNISGLNTGSSGVPFKAGAAYKENDFAAVVNGGTVGTDTTGTPVSGVSVLYLGARGGNAQFLSGHIRQITYLPRRLTNAELQSRTA